MTSVYIKGTNKALNVATWIKEHISDCNYELELDPPAMFTDQYKFNFKSKHDAAMVALRWGNEYRKSI